LSNQFIRETRPPRKAAFSCRKAIPEKPKQSLAVPACTGMFLQTWLQHGVRGMFMRPFHRGGFAPPPARPRMPISPSSAGANLIKKRRERDAERAAGGGGGAEART
jgi:hypothetical protein